MILTFFIIYVITVVVLFTMVDVSEAKYWFDFEPIFLMLIPFANIMILIMIVILELGEDNKDFLRGYKSIRKYFNRLKYRRIMRNVDPYGEEDWSD